MTKYVCQLRLLAKTLRDKENNDILNEAFGQYLIHIQIFILMLNLTIGPTKETLEIFTY